MRAAMTMPLDMESAGGRPLIDVAIGDRTVSFILDSGAAYGVILASHAEAAGARFIEATELSSPLSDGGLPAELVEIDDVSVGAIEIGTMNFSAIPDDAFPLPGGAGGVLPLRLLADNHVVVLDLARGTLALLQEAPAGLTWSELGDGGGQMATTVQIDDLTVPVHLDTGSPGQVLLPRQYAAELGLEDQLSQIGTMRTVDAERAIYGAPFAGTITLAGNTLALDTLRFADLPTANVGSGILGDYAMIIDRGARQIAFAPVPEAQRAAAAGGTSPQPLGLQARLQPGQLGVAGVVAGSRAERAGLMAGDQVMEINGTAVSEIAQADLRQALAAVPLVLTVTRGGETMQIEVPAQ
jgi:hypothetical protein